MLEISTKPPGPKLALGRFFSALADIWRDRQTRASFAGLSEREMQDIGWGQRDRQPLRLGAWAPTPDRGVRIRPLPPLPDADRKAA